MATVACIPLIKALHSKAGIAALERKLDNYSGIVGVLIFTFIQALQVVIAVIPPIQVVGGLSSLPLNQRYLLYHYKSLLSSTFLYFFHLNSTLCNFTYLFFLCCFILFTITSLNKKPTIPATRATPSTTSATVKLPLFTLLPKIVESIIAGSLQGMT